MLSRAPEHVELLDDDNEPSATRSKAKSEELRRAAEAKRDGSARRMLRGDEEAPEHVASGAEAAGPMRQAPREDVGASKCTRPKTKAKEATWSAPGAGADGSECEACCNEAGEPRLVGSSAEVEAPGQALPCDEGDGPRSAELRTRRKKSS